MWSALYPVLLNKGVFVIYSNKLNDASLMDVEIDLTLIGGCIRAQACAPTVNNISLGMF